MFSSWNSPKKSILWCDVEDVYQQHHEATHKDFSERKILSAVWAEENKDHSDCHQLQSLWCVAPPHITERLFVSMRCTRVKASFSGTFLLIQTNTVLSHTLNHMTTVQALDLLAIKHYKRKHTTTVCWLTSHAASLLFFWESCFCTCFASHRCCNPTGKRCVTKQLLSEKLYLN